MENKIVKIQDPEMGLDPHDSRDTVSLHEDSRSQSDEDDHHEDDFSRSRVSSTANTRQSKHLINDEDGSTFVSLSILLSSRW
jgi:hypothetical protein